MERETENIAFKITINDEYICTAGIQEGILTAILNYIKQTKVKSEEIKFQLGGLENYSDDDLIYTKWLIDRALEVGDKIEIEIIRSNKIDRHIKKYREAPELVESEQRKYYEILKQKYGE